MHNSKWVKSRHVALYSSKNLRSVKQCCYFEWRRKVEVAKVGKIYSLSGVFHRGSAAFHFCCNLDRIWHRVTPLSLGQVHPKIEQGSIRWNSSEVFFPSSHFCLHLSTEVDWAESSPESAELSGASFYCYREVARRKFTRLAQWSREVPRKSQSSERKCFFFFFFQTLRWYASRGGK